MANPPEPAATVPPPSDKWPLLRLVTILADIARSHAGPAQQPVGGAAGHMVNGEPLSQEVQ